MDEAILLAINGLRAPWLDPIMGLLGDWGFVVLPVILAHWSVHQRTRIAVRDMLDGWLTLLIGIFWVEVMVKPVVGRVRPSSTESLEGALMVLGRASSSPSFPSGTATVCAAAVAWVFLRHRERTVDRVILGITAAYALVVSIARMYAGAHWPSDILAGWVGGIATAYVIHRITLPDITPR